MPEEQATFAYSDDCANHENLRLQEGLKRVNPTRDKAKTHTKTPRVPVAYAPKSREAKDAPWKRNASFTHVVVIGRSTMLEETQRPTQASRSRLIFNSKQKDLELQKKGNVEDDAYVAKATLLAQCFVDAVHNERISQSTSTQMHKQHLKTKW